jgi:hypothetical protein
MPIAVVAASSVSVLAFHQLLGLSGGRTDGRFWIGGG